MSDMDDHTCWVTEDEQLSQDILYNILASERRRYALYCLEKYQTPLALADLADEVARLEYEAETLTQIPEEDIKHIYVDLYHSHIPKLQEASLVDYSQDQDSVELTYDLSGLDVETLI